MRERIQENVQRLEGAKAARDTRSFGWAGPGGGEARESGLQNPRGPRQRETPSQGGRESGSCGCKTKRKPSGQAPGVAIPAGGPAGGQRCARLTFRLPPVPVGGDRSCW